MNEEKQPNSHKVKTNGYSSATLHRKRDKRSQEADARNRDYKSLSVTERLNRAKSRRGQSKKEIARLTALLPVAKPVEAKPKPTKKTTVATAKPGKPIKRSNKV